ncbi:MAG: hypothetical protein ACXAEN_14830 [Candidatus Thorarchaeota archaeon]
MNLETVEEAQEQERQQFVRKEELTKQTIRMLVTDLIQQVFRDIHPELGDIDKIHAIAEHIVFTKGARNSDEAVPIARRMAMAVNPGRSMVDGVLDIVFAEKLAQGGGL